MKKLKELLKTNSSFSSNLNIGIGDSLYGDLSSVEENLKEESQHDVYSKKKDKPKNRRAQRSAQKNDIQHRSNPQQSKQKVTHRVRNEASVDKQEQQIYSKGGAHYFVEKKHIKQNNRQFQSETKRSSIHFQDEFQNLFDIHGNNKNIETDIKIEKIKYDDNFDQQKVNAYVKDKKETYDYPKVQKEYQASVTTSEQLELMFNSQGSLSSSVTDENSCNGEDIFQLSLTVNYRTNFGQEIGIIGNIPKLGQWDTSKPYKMRWTEGHNWVADNLFISEAKGESTYFMYKYCLLQNGQFQFFEKGLDRIVDLKVACFKIISSLGNRYQENSFEKIKQVEIVDKWEHFAVNFQVFNPGKNIENKIEMRVNGDREQIGNWKKQGPQPMILDQQVSNWLEKDKYGQKVKPYQFPCDFQNLQQHTPVVVRYNYSKIFKEKDLNKQEAEWEREPCRVMEISDPNKYNGQLRKNKNRWLNSEQVWIVNGQINKVDSNFKTKFSFTEVGDTGIYVGNYPLNEKEIKLIAYEGITAVLNIKNKTQDFEYMKELYSKNGINHVINYPIPEFNKTANLCEKLFEGAKIINWMLNDQKHKKIFVHCSAGMTRSPSLAILYLCLYCRIECWQSPVEVYKILKKNRDMIFPNMKAVFKTILQNRQLQYENCIFIQQENQLKQIQHDKTQQKLLEQMEKQKQKLSELTIILEERRLQKKLFKQQRFDKQEDEVNKRLKEWRESQIEDKYNLQTFQQNINQNPEFQSYNMMLKDQQIKIEVNQEFEKQEQDLEDQIIQAQINEAQIISENKRLQRLIIQEEKLRNTNNIESSHSAIEKVQEYNSIQETALEQQWNDQLLSEKENQKLKKSIENVQQETPNKQSKNDQSLVKSKKFSDSMSEIDQWDKIDEVYEQNYEQKQIQRSYHNIRQSDSEVSEKSQTEQTNILNQDQDKKFQFYYDLFIQQDLDIPKNETILQASQPNENLICQDILQQSQENVYEPSYQEQKNQDDDSPIKLSEGYIQNENSDTKIMSPQNLQEQSNTNDIITQNTEKKSIIKQDLIYLEQSYKKLQKITTERQVFQRNYISPNRISFIESPENQQFSAGKLEAQQKGKINQFDITLELYNDNTQQQNEQFKYIKIQETDISDQNNNQNEYDTFIDANFIKNELINEKHQNENHIASTNYSFSQIQRSSTSLQQQKQQILNNLQIKIQNQHLKVESLIEPQTPNKTISEVHKIAKNQDQSPLSINHKNFIVSKLFCMNFEIQFPLQVNEIQSQQDLQEYLKNDSGKVMKLIKDNNDFINDIIKNKKSSSSQILNIYHDLKNLKRQESQLLIEQEIQQLQVSEKEIENLCIDLFYQVQILPVNYFIEDYSILEQQIMIIIKNFDIKIPVIHLQNDIYFIGLYKVECEYKNNQVFIKINDHYESFNKFIIKNERYIQKRLILLMLKYDQSLEKVIDCLINDKQLECLQYHQQQSKYQYSKEKLAFPYKFIAGQSKYFFIIK